MILKKFKKKQGSFNPWPSHICWSSLQPPTISQTCELLGSQCTTANCVKKCFSKIGRLFAETYLCNETSDRQNKYSLETPFLSRFFIFYYFLNLNQDFKANLQYKSCVQVLILWKTRFSQTLRSHIFATKRPTEQNKIWLRIAISFSFFIFYYFLNLN